MLKMLRLNFLVTIQALNELRLKSERVGTQLYLRKCFIMVELWPIRSVGHWTLSPTSEDVLGNSSLATVSERAHHAT